MLKLLIFSTLSLLLNISKSKFQNQKRRSFLLNMQFCEIKIMTLQKKLKPM